MRIVFPIIFILAGIFLILLPFIGSTSDPPTEGSHESAANAISMLFGAFLVIFSGYYLIKGWGPKK